MYWVGHSGLPLTQFPRSQLLNHLLYFYTLLVQVRLRDTQRRVASEHRLVTALLLEEVLGAWLLGLGLGLKLGLWLTCGFGAAPAATRSGARSRALSLGKVVRVVLVRVRG